MPLRSEADEQAGPSLLDVTQAGPFEPGVYDTLRGGAARADVASSIMVHLRIRLTEEQRGRHRARGSDQPGPCRFSGLPCRGVHDLGFLPYPTLSPPHTDHELPLEWSSS